MPSEFTQQALGNLRDGSLFEWNVVPILVLVVYVYAVEIERGNWSVLLAGLALWGMDWLNEIGNALVFHFSGFAPLWAAPADTAYLILIGLNIEICLMFACLGLVTAKTLPADPSARILGVPNRWFLAVFFSVLAVIVELFLNGVDALTWDYAWWSARFPLPIVVFGYLHFFLVAFWVHDMPTLASKIRAVTGIYTLAAGALIVFGPLLHWI